MSIPNSIQALPDAFLWTASAEALAAAHFSYHNTFWQRLASMQSQACEKMLKDDQQFQIAESHQHHLQTCRASLQVSRPRCCLLTMTARQSLFWCLTHGGLSRHGQLLSCMCCMQTPFRRPALPGPQHHRDRPGLDGCQACLLVPCTRMWSLPGLRMRPARRRLLLSGTSLLTTSRATL